MRVLGEAYYHRKDNDLTFLKTISDGGGHIAKLEGDYLATHVYWMGGPLEASTQVMPLKFVKEPENGFFWVKYFDGIYVCWGSDDAIVFHSSVTSASRIGRKALLRKYQQVAFEFEDVNQELADLFRRNSQSYLNVIQSTKHAETTREERVQSYRGNGMVLEKNSFDMLKAILGESIRATPEKCLADCGFTPVSDVNANNMQIQLKSSSKSLFCSTAGYNEMLLVCRSVKYAHLGWLCVPGRGLPNNVELSPNGKYGAFLIRDEEMYTFLSSLYETINNGNTEFTWPKGAVVDISSFLLVSFQDMCVPHSSTDRIEYEANTWRRNLMPQLEFAEAPFQGLPYDVVIENVNIQDKTSKADPKCGRYPVSLSKSMGMTKGKLKRGPYSENDFQALSVMTHDRKYIFLIPTYILSAKEYVSSSDKKGKKALHCYSPDYVRPITGRRPETWTQQYCYRADDPELESKFKAALHNIAEDYRTQA